MTLQSIIKVKVFLDTLSGTWSQSLIPRRTITQICLHIVEFSTLVIDWNMRLFSTYKWTDCIIFCHFTSQNLIHHFTAVSFTMCWWEKPFCVCVSLYVVLHCVMTAMTSIMWMVTMTNCLQSPVLILELRMKNVKLPPGELLGRQKKSDLWNIKLKYNVYQTLLKQLLSEIEQKKNAWYVSLVIYVILLHSERRTNCSGRIFSHLTWNQIFQPLLMKWSW